MFGRVLKESINSIVYDLYYLTSSLISEKFHRIAKYFKWADLKKKVSEMNL